MMYETENGFSALLDELETLYDKDGNRIGRSFPFRKSHQPAPRVAKISRSKHSIPVHYDVADRSEFAKTLREFEGLAKSMQQTPRAATLRLNKPRGTNLRKALTDFNSRFSKAVAAGELSCDDICRIEARLNRLTQQPLMGVI